MKLSLRRSDKLVGVFILVGTVFLVGALAFVAVNKRWFQKDLEYFSHFATAKGLSHGLALEYRGFAIGRVKSLDLVDDDQVKVVFSIYNEYADRISEGSVVELAVQPLGFGSSLVLYRGLNGGQPLPPGSMIPSTDFLLGRQLVRQGKVIRPQRRDEVMTLVESLPPLLGKVESAVGNLDRLLVGLDRTLMGGDQSGTGLLGSVDQTVEGYGNLTVKFERITDRLDEMLVSLTAFARYLEDPDGLIPGLMGTEGSAARLFHDNAELYENLLGAMEELHQAMRFMNESTPEITVLMDETTRALTEGGKVMQGLKNNPLLRGGIPDETAKAETFGGYRGEER